MEYKQVILVRNDLKLPKGKLAVQVAHASVEAVLKSRKETVSKWHNSGAKKVALKIADKKELFAFKQMAEEAGLTTAVITDAGKTVIAPGTVTCMAIGPDEEEIIDKISGKLKLV
jgi:PTH2 family peptidyl-tRNA hydrolase